VRRQVVRVVAVVALVAVGVFGVLAPPERCPAVTVASLDEASALTVDWFVHNQNRDGTWLYQYDAADDRVIDDYNIVRHAGAIMGLYQASEAGYDQALDSADAGLEWLLDRSFDAEGEDGEEWTAITWQGETSVGTVALLTAGLVDRRLATGDDVHDDLLRRLGGFLSAQTEPSGAVLAYYSRFEDGPVPGLYSKYYTGEAYWALTRLHNVFPGEGWGEVSDRIGHYLTQRDEIEGNWPDLPDHWAAYGLSETALFEDRPGTSADHRGPLTSSEIQYAERQAGLFGSQVRWVSQRFGPWGAAVRAPHVPRGGGYGVVGEALTGYWRVADAEPRMADLRAPIAERARCIAGLAILNQTTADDASDYPGDPERVVGAWFRDGETRMDDQQHALSALMRTKVIVESDDAAGGPRDGGDMPSIWLWLVALVAAVDPFRTALAVPRAGRSRREVGVLAGLGGLAASAGVVVVALLSGPLLDALDVSGPAMRLAAGIVGGVAGLLALFGQFPLPLTGSAAALPGRRGALVPVAVPLVVTPALLVLAISANDDHNLGLVAAALLVGTALLAAAAYLVTPSAGAATVPAAVAGGTDEPDVDEPGDAEQGEDATAVPVGGAVAVDPAVIEPEAAVGLAPAAPVASVAVASAEAEAHVAAEVEHGTGGVIARWAGRITALALLVTSVALAIDGVFSV
jgi:small neutral amino acid transporter SnatA (MarC family)